jgi:SPP1 gp7 family putative phage head morphogenesis protein
MPKKINFSEQKIKWHESRKSPAMKGDVLNYNAAVQEKYYKSILSLIKKMKNEVKKEIDDFFKTKEAKEFYEEEKKFAQDASISSQAKILTNQLMRKFLGIFNDKSPDLAEKMVNESLNVSKTNLGQSLKRLSGGLTISTNFMTGDLSDVVKSIVAENVSLIKTIANNYLFNVQKAVLRSITFGEGLKYLVPQLKKFDGITERHARNMALDQTRKAYNSINKERMERVGVKKFEWIHSGGGQKPRKDHIEMSGNIYSFDDLPIIEKSTGERGIPGQAINCRCRMKPVIEFED